MLKIDQEKDIILFSNHQEIGSSRPIIDLDVRLNAEQESHEKNVESFKKRSIINFYDRIQNEVHLTRKTILEVIKEMDHEKSEYLIKNPEGFIASFTKRLKDVVATHVAHNIILIC